MLNAFVEARWLVATGLNGRGKVWTTQDAETPGQLAGAPGEIRPHSLAH